MVTTNVLSEKQNAQIHALWNEEYPSTLMDQFPVLLEGAAMSKHYLILDADENVLAWAVYFQKDDEIRFSILVDRQHQGEGLGKQLITEIKNELSEFSGWVIDTNEFNKRDGTVYNSPLPFYMQLGFEILHQIRIDNDFIKAVKVKFTRQF